MRRQRERDAPGAREDGRNERAGAQRSPARARRLGKRVRQPDDAQGDRHRRQREQRRQPRRRVVVVEGHQEDEAADAPGGVSDRAGTAPRQHQDRQARPQHEQPDQRVQAEEEQRLVGAQRAQRARDRLRPLARLERQLHFGSARGGERRHARGDRLRRQREGRARRGNRDAVDRDQAVGKAQRHALGSPRGPPHLGEAGVRISEQARERTALRPVRAQARHRRQHGEAHADGDDRRERRSRERWTQTAPVRHRLP